VSNTPVKVTVTGAAGQIGYALLFRIASGQMLGPALYGCLLDSGHPQLVFWASAAFSTLAIGTMATGRIWRLRAAAS
jgi:hypothetical protein